LVREARLFTRKRGVAGLTIGQKQDKNGAGADPCLCCALFSYRFLVSAIVTAIRLAMTRRESEGHWQYFACRRETLLLENDLR
jgi:hypothetical protein